MVKLVLQLLLKGSQSNILQMDTCKSQTYYTIPVAYLYAHKLRYRLYALRPSCAHLFSCVCRVWRSFLFRLSFFNQFNISNLMEFEPMLIKLTPIYPTVNSLDFLFSLLCELCYCHHHGIKIQK